MRLTKGGAALWPLIATSTLVFGTGVVMDVAVNSTITGGYAERFLPEVCGLIVGLLTVLTFARRRGAFLGSATVFMLAEMVAVALPVVVELRLVLALACVVTTVACLGMYTRFAWTLVSVSFTGD